MPNLVSVVMQFLTPDMIAKIASVLGLDRNLVQKAIGGAVPALLSSVADSAATPGGMRQLFNLLQQQSGSLDTLKKRDWRCWPEDARRHRIEHVVRVVRWWGFGHHGAVDRQVRGNQRKARASRCLECLLLWCWGLWGSSSAALASMQAA